MKNVKCLEMRIVTFCGRKTCGVKVTGNLNISPFTRFMNSLHAVYKLKCDSKGHVCLNVVALKLWGEFP